MRQRLKTVFLMSALTLATVSVMADVTWLEKDYDFGLMKEIAGPQTGSVRFVNTGNDSVVITGARPSCGCTGVAYPLDPIAPGDTVKFSFTYDPYGRPGKFAKSIRVYIGDYDMATIKIRGNVLGTPESLSTLYPVELGPLRLSEDIVPAGEVVYGSNRNYFINAYNQTTDTIRPAWKCADKALSVTSSAEKVGPGDIVTYSLYFNSRQKPDMGEVSIPIEFIADANHPEAGSHTVEFTANVTPDFSRMTPEQIAEAPRCLVSPPVVDLGVVSGSSPKQIEFLITNEGKSPMRTTAIRPRSEVIKVKRYATTTKPGKSEKVEATLNLAALPEGAFNIKVDIQTDDPTHPLRTISVVGIKE